MKTLSLINTILSDMAEREVTSVDARHPTVGKILANLAVKKEELLSRGWYFNTTKVTAYPDIHTKKIQVNPKILSVEGTRFLVLDGFLFDRDSQTYLFSDPVEFTAIWDQEFDYLPICVQQILYARTATLVYSSDFGQDNKTQQYMQIEIENSNELNMQELRRAPKNSLKYNHAAWRFRSQLRG